MQNPIHQPTNARLALAREFDRIDSTLGVGLALGGWAGRGDWASTSEARKDEAGRRALAELDQLIERLTEFRGRLAELIDDEQQGDAR